MRSANWLRKLQKIQTSRYHNSGISRPPAYYIQNYCEKINQSLHSALPMMMWGGSRLQMQIHLKWSKFRWLPWHNRSLKWHFVQFVKSHNLRFWAALSSQIVYIFFVLERWIFGAQLLFLSIESLKNMAATGIDNPNSLWMTDLLKRNWWFDLWFWCPYNFWTSSALCRSWKTRSKVVNFDKSFLRGFWPKIHQILHRAASTPSKPK